MAAKQKQDEDEMTRTIQDTRQGQKQGRLKKGRIQTEKFKNLRI